MNDLVILHLSDLHFDEKSITQKKTNKSLMESIVESLKSKKVNQVVLVITGDILDKGNKDNLGRATTFFKELHEKLENAKIIVSFIGVVPGNHDKKRINAFTEVLEKERSNHFLYRKTDDTKLDERLKKDAETIDKLMQQYEKEINDCYEEAGYFQIVREIYSIFNVKNPLINVDFIKFSENKDNVKKAIKKICDENENIDQFYSKIYMDVDLNDKFNYLELEKQYDEDARFNSIRDKLEIDFNGYIKDKPFPTYGAHVLETTNGKKIAFILLDTAWSTCNDFDRYNVYLGKKQIDSIESILSKANEKLDYTIALAHHPIDFLYGYESERLLNNLLSNSWMSTNLLLCGHIHDSTYSSITSVKSMVSLNTGIGWPDKEPNRNERGTNHTYSIYTLHLDCNSININVYKATNDSNYTRDNKLIKYAYVPMDSMLVGPYTVNVQHAGDPIQKYLSEKEIENYKKINDRIVMIDKNLFKEKIRYVEFIINNMKINKTEAKNYCQKLDVTYKNIETTKAIIFSKYLKYSVQNKDKTYKNIYGEIFEKNKEKINKYFYSYLVTIAIQIKNVIMKNYDNINLSCVWFYLNEDNKYQELALQNSSDETITTQESIPTKKKKVESQVEEIKKELINNLQLSMDDVTKVMSKMQECDKDFCYSISSDCYLESKGSWKDFMILIPKNNDNYENILDINSGEEKRMYRFVLVISSNDKNCPEVFRELSIHMISENVKKLITYFIEDEFVDIGQAHRQLKQNMDKTNSQEISQKKKKTA